MPIAKLKQVPPFFLIIFFLTSICYSQIHEKEDYQLYDKRFISPDTKLKYELVLGTVYTLNDTSTSFDEELRRGNISKRSDMGLEIGLRLRFANRLNNGYNLALTTEYYPEQYIKLALSIGAQGDYGSLLFFGPTDSSPHEYEQKKNQLILHWVSRIEYLVARDLRSNLVEFQSRFYAVEAKYKRWILSASFNTYANPHWLENKNFDNGEIFFKLNYNFYRPW